MSLCQVALVPSTMLGVERDQGVPELVISLEMVKEPDCSPAFRLPRLMGEAWSTRRFGHHPPPSDNESSRPQLGRKGDGSITATAARWLQCTIPILDEVGGLQPRVQASAALTRERHDPS